MTHQALGSALPIARVAELDDAPSDAAWLIDSLWSDEAVGFIGGAPKCCKSWLGLDMAVSVASATPCLGRFHVARPGPALVYLAEDSLSNVRARIAALCRQREVNLADLDLFVVTAPSLRLDLDEDQTRLDATLRAIRPRFLLLDPLVRMHRIDENSSADISLLLGRLRHIQREHHLAIAIVHHMSKRSRAQLGQALRGSTDLHAFSDSAAYLVRKRERIELTLEHRSASAPDPFELELAGDDDTPHLRCVDAPVDVPTPSPSLDERVRAALAEANGPLTRAALRELLRVNNQRLGDALEGLAACALIERTPDGWRARP
jgi:hypothetical protein